MKRLSGMDAMLLYSEAPNLHTHTLKIAIVDTARYDGPFDFEVFRETFRRRLSRLEPLRYKLVDIPWRLHHPMWLPNSELDVDYHLRRVQVPSPGGRRELDRVIAEIASTPLDRERPLWQFYFAEGMADGRCALVGKVHHALADGVASANLLAKAMDTPEAEPEAHDHVTDVGSPSPTTAGLLFGALRDHGKQIAQLPALIRDTSAGVRRVRQRSRTREDHPDLARTLHAPSTFINHVVSPRRMFASISLSLAEVKETGKQLGITVNDVVMAMAAGGLRNLLLHYDGVADSPLIASILAATNTSSSRLLGNELSGMAVSLPVHIDDPMERVRLTSLSAVIAKEDYKLLGPSLLGRFVNYLPPLSPPAFRWLAERDAPNRLFNLPISNVHGPREWGHFGGAPVSEIYSVGPLPPGCGINITVWSYVDQLNISVLTDDRTLVDPHEATGAFRQELSEIRSAAGLSPTLHLPDTAMPLASS